MILINNEGKCRGVKSSKRNNCELRIQRYIWHGWRVFLPNIVYHRREVNGNAEFCDPTIDARYRGSLSCGSSLCSKCHSIRVRDPCIEYIQSLTDLMRQLICKWILIDSNWHGTDRSALLQCKDTWEYYQCSCWPALLTALSCDGIRIWSSKS